MLTEDWLEVDIDHHPAVVGWQRPKDGEDSRVFTRLCQDAVHRHLGGRERVHGPRRSLVIRIPDNETLNITTVEPRFTVTSIIR